MTDRIKVSRKVAAPILARTFPGYAGRKIVVEFAEQVTFYDTVWGDGSRNFYQALDADGRSGKLVANAPWDNQMEGKTVGLPPDVLIVCHSVFCGKDVGITIYAHPSNRPKWLAA